MRRIVLLIAVLAAAGVWAKPDRTRKSQGAKSARASRPKVSSRLSAIANNQESPGTSATSPAAFVRYFEYPNVNFYDGQAFTLASFMNPGKLAEYNSGGSERANEKLCFGCGLTLRGENGAQNSTAAGPATGERCESLAAGYTYSLIVAADASAKCYSGTVAVKNTAGYTLATLPVKLNPYSQMMSDPNYAGDGDTTFDQAYVEFMAAFEPYRNAMNEAKGVCGDATDKTRKLAEHVGVITGTGVGSAIGGAVAGAAGGANIYFTGETEKIEKKIDKKQSEIEQIKLEKVAGAASHVKNDQGVLEVNSNATPERGAWSEQKIKEEKVRLGLNENDTDTEIETAITKALKEYADGDNEKLLVYYNGTTYSDIIVKDKNYSCKTAADNLAKIESKKNGLNVEYETAKRENSLTPNSDAAKAAKTLKETTAKQALENIDRDINLLQLALDGAKSACDEMWNKVSRLRALKDGSFTVSLTSQASLEEAARGDRIANVEKVKDKLADKKEDKEAVSKWLDIGGIAGGAGATISGGVGRGFAIAGGGMVKDAAEKADSCAKAIEKARKARTTYEAYVSKLDYDGESYNETLW
ncbi:MAG: hypothetical protein LBL52_03245 [Rickettsiales bacterium]|jgi:uncharacterized protein YcfJ|nr:hypothetical protein [Rickettsiales bacterium]